MGTHKLSFGKIASTPTKTAWSQAYNAGDLFCVLTLTQKETIEDEKKDTTLATLGKNFLEEIQTEFFSLDSKNLQGISDVLTNASDKIPEDIKLTVLTAYVKEQTLYVFLMGNGSIILKRGDKIGTLLTNDEEDSRKLHVASGHVKSEDTVVLASAAFQKAIAKDDMLEAISLPEIDDAVEALTPHVHKLDEGSASAVIFKTPISEEMHHEAPLSPEDGPADEEPQENNEIDSPPTSEVNEQSEPHSPSGTESTHTSFENPYLKEAGDKTPLTARIKSLIPTASLSALSHRKKVSLSIAVILVLVLFASVFFTIQNQNAKEREALFDEIYPQALTNYEEAEGLIGLNKALAREQLEEAEELLSKTEGKFPRGTDEYEKTEALKQNIEKLLSEVGDSRTVPTEEISEDENILLATLIPGSRISAVEDETSVYYITEDEIASIRKASKSEQTLVENDDDWSSAKALGKFGSNFYVLDSSNGILKFVPSGSDYAVSDYLTEETDLSDAVSMAIDSSIYVLFENGDIKKFTRGAEESFTTSGIEIKLKGPTQIVTAEEMDAIYILDPETARIVKLNKSGTFQEEYQTSVLQNATAMSISADENTATILSDGKLYEMSL